MEMEYLSAEQIEAGLSDVLASPQDQGQLEAIIIRPESDHRESRASVYLSPEGGVEGDRWATSEGSDPRAQVSLMNARLLKLIARTEDRMSLAGDNLIVDLDLTEANLSIGQKLAVGEVLIQVTELPHTGCKQFAERYGPDAVRFINAAERKPMRLRGLYARVLKAGTVGVGDTIQKVT